MIANLPKIEPISLSPSCMATKNWVTAQPIQSTLDHVKAVARAATAEPPTYKQNGLQDDQISHNFTDHDLGSYTFKGSINNQGKQGKVYKLLRMF